MRFVFILAFVLSVSLLAVQHDEVVLTSLGVAMLDSRDAYKEVDLENIKYKHSGDLLKKRG